MMRGAEAAAVLGEQVEIDAGGRSATIELGPTKTNPAGRECPRTLRCCCGGGESTGLPSSSACPVHALERVLHARAQRGMDGKMPLFPTLGGSTPTRRAVISTLRHLAGDKRLTEHSMRRMGAQYYARHGVPTAFIEFLGRWGGPTVLKYIGEALRERASDASVIARRNAQCDPTLVELRREVQRELQSDQHAQRDFADAVGVRSVEIYEHWEARVQAVATQLQETWAHAWQEVERLRFGGVRRGRESVVHEVVMGDASFPPTMWVTRCGWRFGGTRHERCLGGQISCAKCVTRSQHIAGSKLGGGAGCPRVAASMAAAGAETDVDTIQPHSKKNASTTPRCVHTPSIHQ